MMPVPTHFRNLKRAGVVDLLANQAVLMRRQYNMAFEHRLACGPMLVLSCTRLRDTARSMAGAPTLC